MGQRKQVPVFWRLYGSYTGICGRTRHRVAKCFQATKVTSVEITVHQLRRFIAPAFILPSRARHWTDRVRSDPHYSEERTRNARAHIGKGRAKDGGKQKHTQEKKNPQKEKKKICWKEEFCIPLDVVLFFFQRRQLPAEHHIIPLGLRSGMHGRAWGWAQNASLTEYCMVGWRLGGKPRLWRFISRRPCVLYGETTIRHL